MIAYYRYSSKGKSPQDYGYKKTKIDCLKSFLNAFHGVQKNIILDNCEPEDVEELESLGLLSPFDQKFVTAKGNGLGALWAINHAINNYPSEEHFYFAEDDYVYSRRCDIYIPYALVEALSVSSFATPYDHGDKYGSKFNANPNQLLENGGEKTILFRTRSSHWKFTNSTTMTFAANRKALEENIDLFEKFCINPIPNDFTLFLALRQRQQYVASCIPSLSAHLSPDRDNLPPFLKLCRIDL
jgi:hypothetical protein